MTAAALYDMRRCDFGDHEFPQFKAALSVRTTMRVLDAAGVGSVVPDALDQGVAHAPLHEFPHRAESEPGASTPGDVSSPVTAGR